MLNQDIVNRSKKLLDLSADGSRMNQQAREIAKARLTEYTAMLIQFAEKNPSTKLDAYKQAAYLQALGYNWGIIIREGRYTVQAETVTQHKIADITFEQEEG